MQSKNLLSEVKVVESAETLPFKNVGVNFPPGIFDIIFQYLDGEIGAKVSAGFCLKTKWAFFHLLNHLQRKPPLNIRTLRLFGHPYMDYLARTAAKLILSGSFEDISEAVALTAKYPELLHIETSFTDPCGRTIKATPLQMALLAGDVTLCEDDAGAFEQLCIAGKLEAKEIYTQAYAVVLSGKASASNTTRSEQILKLTKQFWRALSALSRAHNKMDFIQFEEHCKPLIKCYKKSLDKRVRINIQEGYIFDLEILLKISKFFSNEMDNCNEFKNEEPHPWFNKHNKAIYSWCTPLAKVFWIHAIGKLQSLLPSRYLQIYQHGIVKFGYANATHTRMLSAEKSQALDNHFLRPGDGKLSRRSLDALGSKDNLPVYIFHDYTRKLVLARDKRIKEIQPNLTFHLKL